MLRRICNCCQKAMSLSDEDTLNIIVNIEENKNFSFFADLCEECENKLIDDLKELLLHKYNIETESEIETETETEEKQELILIEDKQMEDEQHEGD